MGSSQPHEKRPPGTDTVFSSELLVDPERASQWIAAQWQGQVPAGLTVHSWVVLRNPWRIRLVWEATDDEACAFIERRCGDFGILTTEVATDARPSLDSFHKRDPVAFGEWLKTLGTPEDAIEWQVALRKEAVAAADLEAAIAVGRNFGEYQIPFEAPAPPR